MQAERSIAEVKELLRLAKILRFEDDVAHWSHELARLERIEQASR